MLFIIFFSIVQRPPTQWQCFTVLVQVRAREKIRSDLSMSLSFGCRRFKRQRDVLINFRIKRLQL